MSDKFKKRINALQDRINRQRAERNQKDMHDPSGKVIKEGQIVDIHFNGMIRCVVKKVIDTPVIHAGQQSITPHVMVDTAFPVMISDPSGLVRNLYVVGQLEVPVEVEPSGPKLVIPS